MLKTRSKPCTTAYFLSSSIWKEKNSTLPLITWPCLRLRLSGMDLVVPVFHLVGQFWLSEYKTSFLPWWNNTSLTSLSALRVLRKYCSHHISYIMIRPTDFTSCTNEESPAQWNEKLLPNKFQMKSKYRSPVLFLRPVQSVLWLYLDHTAFPEHPGFSDCGTFAICPELNEPIFANVNRLWPSVEVLVFFFSVQQMCVEPNQTI